MKRLFLVLFSFVLASCDERFQLKFQEPLPTDESLIALLTDNEWIKLRLVDGSKECEFDNRDQIETLKEDCQEIISIFNARGIMYEGTSMTLEIISEHKDKWKSIEYSEYSLSPIFLTLNGTPEGIPAFSKGYRALGDEWYLSFMNNKDKFSHESDSEEYDD